MIGAFLLWRNLMHLKSYPSPFGGKGEGVFLLDLFGVVLQQFAKRMFWKEMTPYRPSSGNAYLNFIRRVFHPTIRLTSSLVVPMFHRSTCRAIYSCICRYSQRLAAAPSDIPPNERYMSLGHILRNRQRHWMGAVSPQVSVE